MRTETANLLPGSVAAAYKHYMESKVLPDIVRPLGNLITLWGRIGNALQYS
jgi:hypothetical protein